MKVAAMSHFQSCHRIFTMSYECRVYLITDQKFLNSSHCELNVDQLRDKKWEYSDWVANVVEYELDRVCCRNIQLVAHLHEDGDSDS